MGSQKILVWVLEEAWAHRRSWGGLWRRDGLAGDPGVSFGGGMGSHKILV